jgi:hypothetical protein
MIDYKYLKAEARRRRGAGEDCKVGDLIALATKNDPFYTGSPAELKKARWFAELWRRFDYTGGGVHLRRIHYQIVSQDPPIKKPDGLLYENTEGDWGLLNNAAKWARYLDLVPAGLFVDRRNPEAIIHYYRGDCDPTPRYTVDRSPDDYLTWEDYQPPTLPELPDLPRGLPDIPDFSVDGYNGIEQPYMVEIWAEKTTMNDVLLPLCKRYKVNLVTGAGELSITACLDFLERAKEAGKPARILYVSDFDPAGLGMPISVARKVEFYQRRAAEYADLDLALDPVVLTAQQIEDYRLPRVPVKDSDKRKAAFEEAHGKGQVELDALEALRPGELAEILRAAILRYFDPQLKDRAWLRRGELKEALDEERAQVLRKNDSTLSTIRGEYDAVLTSYQATREEFAALVADFQEQLDAHAEKLEEIAERGRACYESIAEALDAVDIDAESEYPLPEAALPPEGDGLLYASRRGYFDQLDYYKAQRNGNGGEVS